jgi:tripartite-type tricarboxylate transporter receptor subunit TctC
LLLYVGRALHSAALAIGRKMNCAWNEAINSALQDPGVRKRFEGLGATPQGTTPDKFAQVIASDTAKFAEVIKISGARVD